jgi:hypothetical protein
MKNRGPAPIIAGSLAALLLLFGAYMGSFYAILYWPWYVELSDEANTALEATYWPANQIDRWLWPPQTLPPPNSTAPGDFPLGD